jgi:hypothetical protein
VSADSLVKRFRSRELLNHAAVAELAETVGSFSTMEEFQTFYGKCVTADDELDVPFINRNLILSRNIWQSNYQKLLAAEKAPQS